MDKEPDTMDESAAIKYLGLTTRQNPLGALMWLIREHGVPHYRLMKGVYRFNRGELADWLDARKCVRMSPAGE